METIEKKKETFEERIIRLQRESIERKAALVLSRQKFDQKKTKQGRRLIALELLEKQLESGLKPISKGFKPFKCKDGSLSWNPWSDIAFPDELEWEENKDQDGNVLSKKALKVSILSLENTELIRIGKQITSLKTKLNLI